MRRCVKNNLASDKDGEQWNRYSHLENLEKCMEWQAPIYVNFGEFRKAFDRVIREKVWVIM